MERHSDENNDDLASRKLEAELRVESQIMLAEYAALRAEIERRTSIQWNVFALQIGSAGAISSLAISAVSNIGLLLIIPLISYMLGSRYILHDYHIKLIHRYIEESLSGRLGNRLEWERWKGRESAAAVDKGQPLTPLGWTLFHPTGLAFWGVATAALVAAAVAAVYSWSTDPPRWYIIVAFAVGWIVDVVAVGALQRSFERSSSRGRASQQRA